MTDEPYGDGAVNIGVPKHVRISVKSYVNATPREYLRFLIELAEHKLKEGQKEAS